MRALATIAATLALGLSGCGYHFEGAGSALPGDVQTVAIALLENNTLTEGIEADFTAALIDQFSRGRKIRVVDDAVQADAVVRGIILNVYNRAVSFSDTDEVVEFELIVQAAVGLQRTGDGKILWRDTNLLVREDYAVTADAVVTGSPDFVGRASTFNNLGTIEVAEVEQREAIDRASREFARTVYLRMLEDF